MGFLKFPAGSFRRAFPGLPERGTDELFDRLSDDLLSAADRGDLLRYNYILHRLSWLPRSRRHELRQALSLGAQVVAAELPDRNEGEALLMRLPVLLVTRGPIEHLPPAAATQLSDSLHQHGLLDERVQALFLPWLEPEGTSIDNLVSRKRLLLELALPMIRRQVAEMPRVHITPKPSPLAGGAACTCYMTLALLSSDVALKSVIDGWQRSDNIEKIRQWSAQVSSTIRTNGGHDLVATSLPAPYLVAEMKGAIHRGAFEVKRFLTQVQRVNPDRIAEGEMQMDLTSGLAGKNLMHLRFMYQDAVVQQSMVMLPCGVAPGDAEGGAWPILTRTARSLCQALGVGRFTVA